MHDQKTFEEQVSAVVRHYVHFGFFTPTMVNTMAQFEVDVLDLATQIHIQFQSPVTLH